MCDCNPDFRPTGGSGGVPPPRSLCQCETPCDACGSSMRTGPMRHSSSLPDACCVRLFLPTAPAREVICNKFIKNVQGCIFPVVLPCVLVLCVTVRLCPTHVALRLFLPTTPAWEVICNKFIKNVQGCIFLPRFDSWLSLQLVSL